MAWFRRKSERPFGWDIAFAIAALWLLWADRELILRQLGAS